MQNDVSRNWILNRYRQQEGPLNFVQHQSLASNTIRLDQWTMTNDHAEVIFQTRRCLYFGLIELLCSQVPISSFLSSYLVM